MPDQFREDKQFCYCDRYDFPHKLDSRCPPGYSTVEIMVEKVGVSKPAIKPRVVDGWRCPNCNGVNPLSVTRCKGCGK
jgi:hypothetical protein